MSRNIIKLVWSIKYIIFLFNLYPGKISCVHLQWPTSHSFTSVGSCKIQPVYYRWLLELLWVFQKSLQLSICLSVMKPFTFYVCQNCMQAITNPFIPVVIAIISMKCLRWLIVCDFGSNGFGQLHSEQILKESRCQFLKTKTLAWKLFWIRSGFH